MKFHPYSEIFPLIEGAEFDALVADIRTHGLREKIWLHEGKILDGRNRFLACQKAKVRPLYRKFDGKDAISFVVSLNVQRRHLNASQLSMASGRIATLRSGQRADQVQGTPIGVAAAMTGASERGTQRARQVLEKGSKDLQRAVDSGDVSVSKAAAVVDLPKSAQLAAATKEVKKPDEPDLAVRYEFDAGDEEYIARKDREYQQSIDKVMDSDDRLGTANKEIERLSGLVAMLTRARDEYMAQHGAAMKFIKRLQRDKEKLTSQLESRQAA